MSNKTIQLIIRISVEIVEWISIILKEKKINERNDQNDKQGNSGQK